MAVVVVGVVVGIVVSSGGKGSTGTGFDQAPAKVPAAAAKAPATNVNQGFRLDIPSIGANAQVIPEGASGPNGGSLNIPDNVSEVGWWDGVYQSPSGTVDEQVPSPGQPGVTVFAGHIDSATQGEGALFRLSDVQPGATITVYDQNGKVTHWTVTRVQTVLKSALPASLFVDTGSPQLAVVSCGGPFDSATGHYLDNIIAWTVPAT